MKEFDKYRARGAYHYDWYKTDPSYKACVDKCVEFCEGSTLDVGGGDGLVAKMIKDNGHQSLVLDNSQEALNLLFDIDPLVNFVLADLEDKKSIKDAINDPKQPLPHQKYDFMCALNVIEHLNNPENLKYIFDRYITKAAIIITDFPQEQLSSYHVKEFTPYELKQMFHTRKVKGFKIDDNFHGIEVYK